MGDDFGPPPSVVGPILITGASGFLGSALVEAFYMAGYPVRALVRASSPRANLPKDGIAIVQGDICDRASIAAVMHGVSYVVHAAADYRLWARRPDDIIRTNVEGTRIVMEEAMRAGVERVVYTSSVATLAINRDGTPADESRPLSESAAVGAYKRSKVMAERLVQDMIDRDGLPAVIVNPSTPIGPRDVKPTPTGRIIVEAASGRMPGFVDTGLNLVHVDDVAAGHLAAMHNGQIGQRYILGGENVLLSAMLADIAALVDRSPPVLKLPRGLIYPLALGAEAMAHLTGRTPFVTLDGLRMARHRMFFTDTKARNELGYTTRPYREGLADAIAWFRSSGYLR
ncbi:hopanoid-associated sugar epimerase [Microvirga alba]|uniref:NAD-dependent epimerase/dehydratase family protein n=1 Tax=Microvirga alba TaxID=2791025 RepID=A0A931BUC5_9HYPH|nr:hopanoid-associated sugar epimerase [Microvirga alba]MBF9235305.1 NAD-dependent epimerase/dehydratase family protein [Microvirga alba]